jgi:hypothetical protein
LKYFVSTIIGLSAPTTQVSPHVEDTKIKGVDEEVEGKKKKENNRAFNKIGSNN